MPTKNQALTRGFAWKPAARGAVGRAAGVAGWPLGPAGAGAGRGGLVVAGVIGQRPYPVAEFDALAALFAGGFDRMTFGAQ